MSESDATERDCWWRWRFQPVFGIWGHLGIDYSFEDPRDSQQVYLLRHVDYGLPGDRSAAGYRHSIARYCACVCERGAGWPPLRTPKGYVYIATAFRRAPRSVGEYLLRDLPAFFGESGAYRRLGPNSNTGLRAALLACEYATGYRFGSPPIRIRVGAFGWGWRGVLAAQCGPYPGYFDDASFRWEVPDVE